MASARVAVVGGGLSGLAAAEDLARHGFEVVVLERDERPGGRARSCRRKSFSYEPGGHVLASSDRSLLALVQRAGLAESLLPLRPVALAQVERDAPLPIDPTSARGLARIPRVRWRGALRLARLERILGRFGEALDPEVPEGAAAQDDRSAADFTRLYFGRSVLDGWIAPWLADVGLCRSEETSRVLALLLIAARRFATTGTLRGDLGEVAETLAASLRVRLGEDVLAVERSGRKDLCIRTRVGGGEGSLEAEAAVVALPAPDILRVAEPILSTAERDELGATRHVAAWSLAVGLEAPPAAHAMRIRVPPAQGWPLCAVSLDPGSPGGRVPEGHGLATLLSAVADPEALATPDEVVTSRLLPYLDRLSPGAVARALWTHVERHPRALPLFSVGRYRALQRLRRVEADHRARGRRLYLAGDHLVAPTLEGAVASGIRAARAVRADLG